MRVRPGERVPLDGRIDQGHSAFNEAPITGESLPVDKSPGDAVFAGSINGSGVVEVLTTAAANGSVLARIIDTVRNAQASKAPTQRFIDRFASIYTPVVLVAALLFAVATPLLGWLSWHEAIYNALVMLVIACPCALVIATPVTVVSALASAAKHGLLIKGGAPLETAARIDAVCFDKTGTLTEGEPQVTGVVALADADQDQLLRWAAALTRIPPTRWPRRCWRRRALAACPGLRRSKSASRPDAASAVWRTAGSWPWAAAGWRGSRAR